MDNEYVFSHEVYMNLLLSDKKVEKQVKHFQADIYLYNI